MMSDLKEYLIHNQDYDRDTARDKARDAMAPAELTYYYEADEAIYKYEADYADEAEAMTSGSEYSAGQWLEAKMAYAQALNYFGRGAELEAEIDGLDAELDELEGELDEFNDALADYFECYYPDYDTDELKVCFSARCEHGFAVHNFEEGDGVMFWEANRDAFNPEWLEGEMLAIGKTLSCGAYVYICMHPPVTEGPK